MSYLHANRIQLTAFLVICCLLLFSIFEQANAVRPQETEPAGNDTLSSGRIFINGDDTIHMSKGCLRFIPRPEIYICFCGEYYLDVQEPKASFYLTSDSIDLREYIDKEILVAGNTFTRICNGTLAMPCHFIDVIEITPVSDTGSAEVNWGFLKRIYGK